MTQVDVPHSQNKVHQVLFAMWASLKKTDLDDATPFPYHIFLCCTQRKADNDCDLISSSRYLFKKKPRITTGVLVDNIQAHKAKKANSWNYTWGKSGEIL